MDDKILIEYYKVTRNSVEHFDRLLAQFRQIMFTFNGIFMSTCITLFLTRLKNADIRYIKFFLISSLLAIINILIWLLEKHYHRYLIASADVANKIEEKLFPGDEDKQLTYHLGREREYKVEKEKFLLCRILPYTIKLISRILYKPSFFIRTYDFIYLLPIATSLFFNIYLGYEAKASAQINWLLQVGYSLVFLCLIATISILVHNYYFEKTFNRKNCVRT